MVLSKPDCGGTSRLRAVHQSRLLRFTGSTLTTAHPGSVPGLLSTGNFEEPAAGFGAGADSASGAGDAGSYADAGCDVPDYRRTAVGDASVYPTHP